MSVSSYKSANSKGGLSSAKSLESVTSNGDSRSMVTAVSGSIEDEENRAVTPTTEHDYVSGCSLLAGCFFALIAQTIFSRRGTSDANVWPV